MRMLLPSSGTTLTTFGVTLAEGPLLPPPPAAIAITTTTTTITRRTTGHRWVFLRTAGGPPGGREGGPDGRAVTGGGGGGGGTCGASSAAFWASNSAGESTPESRSRASLASSSATDSGIVDHPPCCSYTDVVPHLDLCEHPFVILCSSVRAEGRKEGMTGETNGSWCAGTTGAPGPAQTDTRRRPLVADRLRD